MANEAPGPWRTSLGYGILCAILGPAVGIGLYTVWVAWIPGSGVDVPPKWEISDLQWFFLVYWAETVTFGGPVAFILGASGTRLLIRIRRAGVTRGVLGSWGVILGTLLGAFGVPLTAAVVVGLGTLVGDEEEFFNWGSLVDLRTGFLICGITVGAGLGWWVASRLGATDRPEQPATSA